MEGTEDFKGSENTLTPAMADVCFMDLPEPPERTRG